MGPDSIPSNWDTESTPSDWVTYSIPSNWAILLERFVSRSRVWIQLTVPQVIGTLTVPQVLGTLTDNTPSPTPGHFLVMRAMNQLPEPDSTDMNSNASMAMDAKVGTTILEADVPGPFLQNEKEQMAFKRTEHQSRRCGFNS